MSIQKTNVQLEIGGQSAQAYLAAPARGGPGVLVLHAWWGLKPFFKQVCDRLAEQGFTALAPDLYQGRIAQTIDEAKALMQERQSELMGETVKAAKTHLLSTVKGKSIAIIGFSMGAGWAIDTAADAPEVSAAVLFYGAGEADFTHAKAKFLGHFAEVDEWESLDYVREMEQSMKAAGLDVTIHVYPGVGHWFVEEDRPEFDATAAKLAWDRTFEFLKKTL